MLLFQVQLSIIFARVIYRDFKAPNYYNLLSICLFKNDLKQLCMSRINDVWCNANIYISN